MEESCRTYDLSVAGSLYVDHLGGLRAEEHHEAVLGFLFTFLRLLYLGSGHARKARHNDEHRYNKFSEKFHWMDLGYLRTFSFQASRSKSQSPKRGSITMYVTLIFESMKSLIAFI